MNTLTALFLLASTSFNLPPKLIDSICYVETKYDRNAIHHDDGNEDSLGLCQVQLSSAQTVGFRGTAKELMDPKVNTIVAAAILKRQINRYHGNITKAIIAYNLGHAGSLTHTKYSDKVFTQWEKSK
jgi:soluble lytic murein transglycosylase-like protein